MPGIQGLGTRSRMRTPRNLLFAREIVTPTGRRIVAASDEHVGLGEMPREARKDISEFNLIDIRFDKDGTGLGKIAAATDVAFSPQMKILEVKDFAARPARLIDIKSQKSTFVPSAR
jgi:hypothetical protein